MYRIAVCVNQEKILNFIAAVIKNYAARECMEVSVVYFRKPIDLYQEMSNEEGHVFDLIYLEVESSGAFKKSILFGRWLRDSRKDEWTQIVFLSESSEACLHCMKARPFNYRIFPITEKQIISDIAQVMELQRKKGDVFTYKYGATTRIVRVKDIMYFESNAHKIEVVMSNQQTGTFYDKICNIAEKLSVYNFLWIHNSILVNSAYIQEISPNQITLTDGTTLPISKAYKKNIIIHRDDVITL